MLESQPEVQIMTVQNLDGLDTKNAETMQNVGGDKPGANAQQQLTASKNGHISFSVASLLADTRPARQSSPNSSTVPSSSPAHHSSDEDYDSNQEDSIVDVEDLQAGDQKSDGGHKDDDEYRQQREFAKETLLNQGPIRPTPFSALAAAVYQAAHPNWPHQGLVNPFAGPGPIFQGSPFGVGNMNSGNDHDLLSIRAFCSLLCYDGVSVWFRIYVYSVDEVTGNVTFVMEMV